MPVVSHADERQAVGIAVGRIEVEIVAAVALAGAVTRDRERAAVVLRRGLLPARSPAWRPGRHRSDMDRRRAEVLGGHIGAADKSQARVVKVVAVEFIDRGTDHAAADKRIEFPVLEKQRYLAAGLIGIISSDHALVADRVVRLADAGEQHQPRVVESVGGEYHQIGGLFNFTALRIDVSDTPRAFFR